MGSRICMAILAGAVFAAPVWAEDHDFKTTIVYRLVSVERVGDKLIIEAEGSGVSSLLGPFTAIANVSQDAVGAPCPSYRADFYLTAADGTIQLHSEGTVCPPPDEINGAWYVAGATGAFAGATGSGTERGKQSFAGADPVVDHLEGTLSY